MKQDPAAFNFSICCFLDAASVSVLYASQPKHSFLLQSPLARTVLGPLPNKLSSLPIVQFSLSFSSSFFL